MTRILIITILFIQVNLFAQSDSIIVKKHRFHHDKENYYIDTITKKSDFIFLVGTTKLPNSLNQSEVISKGLIFTDFRLSECLGDKYTEPKIRSIYNTDSTLVFDVKLFTNCCYSFFGDVSIVGDSILNLIYLGYIKEPCLCNCCLGLSYGFKTNKQKQIGEILNQIKFVMINNNFKSMKRITINEP